MKVTCSCETSEINLTSTGCHTKTWPSAPKNRNGKVYLPCTCHKDIWGGAEVKLHSFLTLTLIGDKSPHHISADLPPEKEPSVLVTQVAVCTAEHASTKGRIFWPCWKRHTIRGSRSSYYTDWVIPVRRWRPWQTNIRKCQPKSSAARSSGSNKHTEIRETYETIHNSAVKWNEMNGMEVTRGSIRCEAFFRRVEVLHSA